MRNPQGFTFVELSIVVIIIGVLATLAIPTYVSMQDRAKESQVSGNAHTLQLAVEDFAVCNDGEYSVAQADILPLLPGASRFANAFTGAMTEPQFGSSAVSFGQVGLLGVQEGARTTGYIINGWGKDGEILVYSRGQ